MTDKSSTKWRIYVFNLCILGLIVQTYLAYSDYPEPDVGTKAVLSEPAIKGLKVWRKKNCQSCHQIHGFGGFLGPDLTNVVHRISEARFDAILTYGSFRMPAFKLSKEDIQFLHSFFIDIDKTGQGTLKLNPDKSVPWFTYPLSSGRQQ